MMMNKLRGTIVAILAAGALACAALAMAQAIKQAPPAREPSRQLKRYAAIIQPDDMRITGVNVVRLINTAEMEYKRAHGSYATWPELYRSGVIAKHEKQGTMFGNLNLSEGPEVVPGWTLAMIVAADGQSYELSLHNLPDKCQFSFFSDQRGLIYEGNVIGCEAVQVVPAHQ